MFYAEGFRISTIFLLSLWFIGFGWFPVLVYFKKTHWYDYEQSVHPLKQHVTWMYTAIFVHQALFHLLIFLPFGGAQVIPDMPYGAIASSLAFAVVLKSSYEISLLVEL